MSRQKTNSSVAGLPFLIIAALCLLPFATWLAWAETNEVEQALVTDSDGDGMSDWEEWIAGTNPGDPTSRFHVVQFEIESGQYVIEWTGTGTATYEVVSADVIEDIASNAQRAALIVATGGVPPWYDTVCTASNNLDGAHSNVAVRLVVPQLFGETVLDMATFE